MKRIYLTTTLALAFGAVMAQESPEAEPSVPKIKVGSNAPLIKLTSWVKGRAIEGIVPGQVTVVEFWAAHYPPSVSNLIRLTRYAKTYKENLAVVGVSMEPDSEDLRKILTRADDRIELSLGFDNDEYTTLRSYLDGAGVQRPTTFIVDQDGKIAWFGDGAQMARPLKRILAKTWNRDFIASSEELEDKLEARTENLGKQPKYSALVERWEKASENSDAKTLRALLVELKALKPEDVPEHSLTQIIDEFEFDLAKVEKNEKAQLAICDRMEKWALEDREGEPANVYADKERLGVFRRFKRWDKAVEVVARLAKNTEDDLGAPPKLYKARVTGSIYTEAKDYKSALKVADELANLSEEDVEDMPAKLEAEFMRLDLYKMLKDTSKALATVDSIGAFGENWIGPVDQYLAFTKLNVFYDIEDTKGFYNHLKASRETLEKNPTMLNNAAWHIVGPESTLKFRDLDLAIELANLAVTKTERRQSFILDTLAWAYFQKGDKAKAVELEQEAIQVEQNPERKKSYEDTLKKFQGKF